MLRQKDQLRALDQDERQLRQEHTGLKGDIQKLEAAVGPLGISAAEVRDELERKDPAAEKFHKLMSDLGYTGEVPSWEKLHRGIDDGKEDRASLRKLEEERFQLYADLHRTQEILK